MPLSVVTGDGVLSSAVTRRGPGHLGFSCLPGVHKEPSCGSSHFHFAVVAVGSWGRGSRVSPRHNWGGGRPHTWPLRDGTIHHPLAASSKDTSGKFAGAGSEAFGVWMKKKSKRTTWQLVSEDSTQPSSRKNLLPGVPREARVPEEGRGARTRDNKMRFLRQLIDPAST